uniref:Uncharacterized protein n=1 Tax=Proboscia inermis TaxID=420281 RepID=A0A7S0BWC3_9STRA|mmetsp:Transcript_10880/g.11004  ORF Transcript_10880/g.11004 Transcript_10880/m.11004 type:complete len:282 (+) Transcript_10880:241-1086(+)|eukprot:CAMPEP_0171296096 /NCGR_PEP_ID=MMETSP0816-20121228/4775_1 /TAXON_ID=420281 /ORGANISM="Proboscia inermis, Strain CCAP1064/1" /LENGTH=281 /DNA_ID=CAMNT_0011769279 /DNA_START=190 /DNA_END=1035 /DNA_ORIENTATION=-
MRLVETEEQKDYGGNIRKIVVKCIPENTVRIRSIVNPKCWREIRENSNENKQYLKANVEILVDESEKEDERSSFDVILSDNDKQSRPFGEQEAQSIASDYDAVRLMYLNSQNNDVATGTLPPFAKESVKHLPALTATDFFRAVDAGTNHEYANQSFWEIAEVWQRLCNTVREARRCILRSDVNEISVAAAMEKGGMLNLPVKREDLPYDVRTKLFQIEDAAWQNYLACGMDPVLDFQGLLSASSSLNPSEQMMILGNMIENERKRLEAKNSLRLLLDTTGK